MQRANKKQGESIQECTGHGRLSGAFFVGKIEVRRVETQKGAEMKIKYPDYKHCITNLANSILNHFGLEGGHESLELCDTLLKKEYQNVIILLLDGMGKNIMDRNLEPDGFFQSHLAGTYSSVFPPTTVAATTTISSGKNPSEHSWLGWDCYYKPIDKNVTVFLNRETETGKTAAEFDVAGTYCPYENIVDRIRESGQHAYYATPFAEPNPASFDQICERIIELCEKPEKKYIYAYWVEPDKSMHQAGCYAKESRQVLQRVERQVSELCRQLSDTLVIVTADHGHVNSDGVCIRDYPRIMECLVRMPSIEPRALNLFVKKGMEGQFEREFAEAFGEKFLLFTKKQVKEKKLFGAGREHERFDEMLGDYLAVAVSDLSVYHTREEADSFIGVHAGLTEDEMTVPLIVIEIPEK